MNIFLVKSIRLSLAALAIGALGACGNLSHKVAADGSGAQELVWPAKDSTTSPHKGGSFPLVSEVRLIQAGMSKAQITALIGTPHFNEGIAGVREWNYLFNFHKDGTGTVSQCEYKILFDQQKLARSFYWQPASCAAILEEPTVKTVAGVQTFTLLSDALFVFDKSDVSSIKPGGMEQLASLARKIQDRGDAVSHVQVVGYTDRMGSDAYNQTLSEKRADTVMQVLKDHGVPADRLEAKGVGEADPVKSCDEQKRASLIACLAPNRRVEVTVDGKSK